MAGEVGEGQLFVFPPEDGDRQAVERLVRRLGRARVSALAVLVFCDPGRDLLPQVLPLLRHRRREDLHAVESRRRVVLMLCHRCVDSFWRLYVFPYSSVSSPTAMFASSPTENASPPP